MQIIMTHNNDDTYLMSSSNFSETPRYFWVLKKLCWEKYRGSFVDVALYSTREKAIEGFPSFMDKQEEGSNGDWRNGIEGLGREDLDSQDDQSLGFRCFLNAMKAKDGDGTLLINDMLDSSTCKVEITLERVLLDPPTLPPPPPPPKNGQEYSYDKSRHEEYTYDEMGRRIWL